MKTFDDIYKLNETDNRPIRNPVSEYAEKLLSDPSIDDIEEIIIRIKHRFGLSYKEAETAAMTTPFK